MYQIINRYIQRLETHPYTTHSITAGILWCSGDLLAQKLEKTDHGIDWKRLGIMTSFGFICAGPAYAYWYSLLDRKLTPRFINNLSKLSDQAPLITPHMQKWKLTVSKMLLDFALFDPLFLSFFFTTTTVASTQSIDKVQDKLKEELLGTYVAEIEVWAPIQLINFRYVPVSWQPVVVNVCNVGWNAYLTHVQNR